ncbi:MAG TPA: LysE family translocator [Candidatus Acidoferrum sp.]|nr:LysE family translocator [Candidatus Acidoferrum sp.]
MEIVLPSVAHIGAFAIAGFALLLVPGPAVLYIVGRSIEQGRVAGVVSVLGITTGTMVHVVAAVVGLSALVTQSVLAFSIVKYAGAAYLIYIGVRRLLSRKETSAEAVPLPQRSLRRLYSDGFVVNLLNPKTALFFLAFLPQFVEGKVGVPSQIAFLGLLFAFMGMLSDTCYALLAGTAGGWMKRRRGFLKAERYLTGGVFVGLGLTAAFAGGDARK